MNNFEPACKLIPIHKYNHQREQVQPCVENLRSNIVCM